MIRKWCPHWPCIRAKPVDGREKCSAGLDCRVEPDCLEWRGRSTNGAEPSRNFEWTGEVFRLVRQWSGAAALVFLYAGCTDGASADFPHSTQEFSAIFEIGSSLDLEEADGVVTVTPEITPHGDELWVADAGEAQVRKYSRTGDLIVAFGKRGQGPGEMDTPAKALPISEEAILVVDRFRSPNFGIWRDAEGIPEFLGYAAFDGPGMFSGARLLADGRIVLASSMTTVASADSLPFGLFVGAIDSTLTSGRFQSTFAPIDIATSIPPNLIAAHSTGGWPMIDVRKSIVAVASSLQDTIRLYDAETLSTSVIPLRISEFRPVGEPPVESWSSATIYQTWLESFSQIDKLFLPYDDLIVVQYLDVIDRAPEYHLLGITARGCPLFHARNVPRLLAWDELTERFIGYRTSDGYPNQLAWYALSNTFSRRNEEC